MIIENVFRRKGRTLMCITAIAISTALLVSLLSVAEGIWQNASYSILGSREDIIIKPNLPSGGGTVIRQGINNGHKLADEIKSDTINISEVSPMHLWWLQITTTNADSNIESPVLAGNLPVELPDDLTSNVSHSGVVLALGVIPERLKNFFADEHTYNLDIIKFKFDTWFETPDDPHYRNNFTGPWTYELLIDEHLAKTQNLRQGSKVNLSIDTNSAPFSVTGIFKTNLLGGYFEDYVDGIVILHLSELQSILGDDVVKIGNQTVITDNVETLAISLNPNRPKENSPKDIAYTIQEKYPLLDVLTKEDQLKALEEQNAITNIFYTAISIVAIIIGLLFVACIMLISVYERINEIGTLRAIGISKITIFKWIMLESLLLVILGVLIGFLPGYLGSKLLGTYISTSLGINQELTAFSPGLLMSAFAGIVVMGTFISLIPALRASQMKIAQALSFVR